MNKKNFSISKWLDENKLYLLAFILPVISMLFVYYFKDVYPFGDQMYLRSDCYHQYAPYLDILKEKLSSGGSLLYTWEIGGGMNFVALAAYYLASPFNLLVLFLPGTISDAVSFFIVAKMGLAGFSAAYYLSKRFGNKDLIVVIFSMLYQHILQLLAGTLCGLTVCSFFHLLCLDLKDLLMKENVKCTAFLLL